MTDLKLWVVDVEIHCQVVVLAGSRREAERVARSDDVLGQETLFASAHATGNGPLESWKDAIPYGARDPDDPDRTVAEWRELLSQGPVADPRQVKMFEGAGDVE